MYSLVLDHRPTLPNTDRPARAINIFSHKGRSHQVFRVKHVRGTTSANFGNCLPFLPLLLTIAVIAAGTLILPFLAGPLGLTRTSVPTSAASTVNPCRVGRPRRSR